MLKVLVKHPHLCLLLASHHSFCAIREDDRGFCLFQDTKLLKFLNFLSRRGNRNTRALRDKCGSKCLGWSKGENAHYLRPRDATEKLCQKVIGHMPMIVHFDRVA